MSEQVSKQVVFKQRSLSVLKRVFAVLLAITAVMALISVSREFRAVDTARNRFIEYMQTKEERLAVPTLKAALENANTEVAQLKKENEMLYTQVNKLAGMVSDQRVKIDNALVIEGSVGEMYDNRVKPRVAAVKAYFVEKTDAVSGYITLQYQKLAGNGK